MTRRIQGATGILLFATAAVVVLWLSSFERQAGEGLRPSPEAGRVGTEENPNARIEYEQRRLRSPATERIPTGIRQRELAFAEQLPKRAAKSDVWQQRGPSNVGGRTRALAIDASDETVILAGGVSGGIWRSTDAGTTWNKTTAPTQLHSVTWLEQDPRSGKEDIWYAGTGEYRGNSAGGGGASYRGDGIFKSTDGGQSWSLLSSTSTSTPHQWDQMFDYVWKVAINPSNTSHDEVYAATYGGIHRSTDGGATWSMVLGHGMYGSTSRYTDVVVTSAGVVYAALEENEDTADDEDGIFRSTDGTSWTEITPDGWPSIYDRIVLAVNSSSENEVWAITPGLDNGPNGHELWLYDADADAWTDYTDRLPARGGTSGDFSSQNSYDLVLAVHPDDGNTIFAGGRNLWRIDTTANASDANTWIGGYTHHNSSYSFYAPLGSDEHHPDQHAIAFLPSDGDVMYTGSDGGVHRTDDNRAGSAGNAGDGAITWTSLNDGYYTTQFYAVCFNSDEANPVIAGGMQDNGTWSTTSTSPDDDWIEEWGGDGGDCAIQNKSAGEGTYRYVSSQNGNVYRLDYDANGNYQGWTEIDPSGASNQLFINPFALDPTTPTVMFYPAGATMWRTDDVENADGSTGWTEMTGVGGATSAPITALDVSTASDAHVLYYGTDGGSVYRLDEADAASVAATPSDVTGTNFPSGAYVSSIAVDPTDADRVMVVFSNYEVKSAFYTADGGSTWSDVSGDLEENADGSGDGPSVRSAAILPQAGIGPTTYYVGTSTGLYATTSLDGTSTTWMQEGATTIGNVVVDQVQARPADGLVLVGTHANGVYSMDAPLPVELTSFDAVADAGSVRLIWQTASETNNAGFEVQVQESGSAGTWEQIGFVEGGGTTSELRQYRHIVDDLTPGRYRFRLKQLDVDGTFEYSAAVEATVSLADTYRLTEPYPNPFRGRAQLHLTVQQPQHVRATLYDMLGRRVAVLHDGPVKAHVQHDLSVERSALPSGMYLMRVDGETFTATRKLTRVQ